MDCFLFFFIINYAILRPANRLMRRTLMNEPALRQASPFTVITDPADEFFLSIQCFSGTLNSFS